MATVAREASITYAGYTVGGAETGRILRDVFVSEDGYESARVEFTFTIQEETVALFSTACAAAEAAFHAPHGALTVTGLGSKSFSHTSRTGFNAVASITKVGSPHDSGLARTYKAVVEVGRPADSGSTGRRLTRTSINVAYGAQRRRTVTISGEWTGIGASSARAQYEAQITSYGDSILSGLTGTFKVLGEPQTTSDDANNVIRISKEYEEILNTDVGGSDADIRSESIRLTRTDSQPGDTPVGGTAVIRLGHIGVQYSAYLEKNGGDLRSKWTTLQARIVALARTTYSLGAVIVVDEAPSFDYTENQITASMTLVGIPGNQVVECEATTEFDTDEGIVLVPVWDGNAYSRYKFQGPAADVMKISIRQQVLGRQLKIKDFPDSFADPNASNGELILKHTTRTSHPVRIGGSRGNASQELSNLTEVRVYERAKLVQSGTSSPGTPTSSDGTPGPGGGSSLPVSTPGGGGGGDWVAT